MRENTTNTAIVVTENAKITETDLRKGKPVEIHFTTLKEGKSEDTSLRERKYDLCCTYNAYDAEGNKFFEVRLGDNFHKLSKETQMFLADVEIAHVLRGHMSYGHSIFGISIFGNKYAKYLLNNKSMMMRADIYTAMFGHQKLNEEIIEKIFTELEAIPMSKRDAKILSLRKEHLLNIIEYLNKKEK